MRSGTTISVTSRFANHRVHAVLLAILGAAFLALFLMNAWVVDDAYITFRVVDNLVHGRGMTWNPGQRVQAFTHPLWMLVMSAAYALTGDVFRTSVFVSLLFCLGALALAWRWLAARGETWRLALLLVMLLSSKAAMDFTSSGLENALSYFLLTAFVLQLPKAGSGNAGDGSAAPRRLGVLAFIASLAFVNRHDSLLLYLPALGWFAWNTYKSSGSRVLKPLLLGAAPAVSWLVFATWYFGFPLPNTYYAKVTTGVPLGQKLGRGLLYFGNSMEWDAISHLMVLACLWFAWRRRSRPALLSLCGLLLYYAFILFNACTTHMSGRFFSVPFFLALLWLAILWPARRAAVLAIALLLFNLWNPLAPMKMGTRWYHARSYDASRLDTNYSVHLYGPHVLFGHQGDPKIPDHEWFERGLAFRDSPVQVNIGGPGGGEPVGYFGFAAGPDKIVLDYCGLTDPLLARLPACNTDSPARWKSGHFYRLPPKGYVESLASGRNVIEDPGLHEYYESLLLAVRDPDLMSGARLAAIARLNLGRCDHLLDAYARTTERNLAGEEFVRALRDRLGLTGAD